MSNLSTEQEALYWLLLNALDNLGEPSELAKSDLVSSCLIKSQLNNNSSDTSAEALQELLLQLRNLLEVKHKKWATLLKMRFWEGLTLEKICADHNPEKAAYRTIQGWQQKAIKRMVSWFQAKEEACRHARIQAVPTENPNFIDKTTEAFEGRLLEDFRSYQIDEFPKNWKQYGLVTTIRPTISSVSSRPEQPYFNFPELRDTKKNLDVTRNNLYLKCPYVITTQFNFLTTHADRAGLLLAWRNRASLIRLQANVYWNHLEYWEYEMGDLVRRIEVPIPFHIEQNTSYWLKATAKQTSPEHKSLTVSWSLDGSHFSTLIKIKQVSCLEGLAGLSSSGMNLPHVHFYNFSVQT